MKQTGVRWKSFSDAARGIRYGVGTQPNLRIHAAITAVVIAMAWGLGVSGLEWCVLLLSIGLVWVAELMNTAVERVVNLASPAYHELARQSKDCAAGAVLFAALIAVLIGIVVFLPRLWSWLFV